VPADGGGGVFDSVGGGGRGGGNTRQMGKIMGRQSQEVQKNKGRDRGGHKGPKQSRARRDSALKEGGREQEGKNGDVRGVIKGKKKRK